MKTLTPDPERGDTIAGMAAFCRWVSDYALGLRVLEPGPDGAPPPEWHTRGGSYVRSPAAFQAKAEISLAEFVASEIEATMPASDRNALEAATRAALAAAVGLRRLLVAPYYEAPGREIFQDAVAATTANAVSFAAMHRDLTRSTTGAVLVPEARRR